MLLLCFRDSEAAEVVSGRVWQLVGQTALHGKEEMMGDSEKKD